jgi:hypothetical protein
LCQAYKRIKSRKSKIGSDILDDIKRFFRGPEFAGKRDKIREYVLWALRPGGPAYYAKPTPKECKVSRKEPGYIVRIFCLNFRNLTNKNAASGGLLRI